jgi:NAD kinase
MGIGRIHDKIVLVTRKTALDELVERFNSRDHARFMLKNRGSSTDDIEAAHHVYYESLSRLRAAVPRDVRLQLIDRGFLPSFLFGRNDLIVTLGPDGLVVNTAKYLESQPILAVNPDLQRIDGVLLPFSVNDACDEIDLALHGACHHDSITMAVARLDDGQELHAVNDLFIGRRTHVSARYQMRFRGAEENQSSSGVIVSTGAGSTGWFRSVVTGAAGVAEGFIKPKHIGDMRERYRFDATAQELRFSVREPFVSRTSSAEMIYGSIGAGETLELVSQMPQDGVIFSDGVESDFLRFDSGTTARIGIAERKVNLLRPSDMR